MTNWIIGHTERFRAAAERAQPSATTSSAFGTTDIGWTLLGIRDGRGLYRGWTRRMLVEGSPAGTYR
jgi:dipeptidyl aminopeptidase/acylaminoacyl peptidase